jgi:ribosomal protein L37AE/L43A
MTKILEKEIVNQDCPHCKEHISIAWVCKLEADGIIRFIYFCPSCQKPLHISNKKGGIKTPSSIAKTFQV